MRNDATTTGSIGDEIARLAAELTVGEHRLVRKIGDFDASGDWARQGALTCAHWLTWRIGLGPGAAREKVRVARALPALPHIDGAFERGELSYSKVRALTRVATAESDEDLAQVAKHTTASQLECVCRRFRRVLADDARTTPDESGARRKVESRWADDGRVRLTIQLPPDEGSRLLAALDSARAAAEKEAPGASRADGLRVMVESWFESGARPRSGGAPHEVVVHVSAQTLALDAAAPDEHRSETRTEGRRVPAETRADESGSERPKDGGVPAKARTDEGGSERPKDGGVPAETRTDEVGSERPKDGGVPAGTWTEEIRGLAAEAAEADDPAETRFDRGGQRADGAKVDVPAETPGGIQSADAERFGEASARRPARIRPAAQGPAWLDNHEGPGVSAETARRLACDASKLELIEDSRGRPLDVGRKSRTVPSAMRRALLARDSHTCAFPGCTHTRYLDAHHVHHWADGGPTRLDNLVLLCSRHHTFVHEHGFAVERDDGGGFVFRAPNGARLAASPRPPEVPDALEAFADHRRGERITVHALSLMPDWRGEDMDYVQVLDFLCHRHRTEAAGRRAK